MTGAGLAVPDCRGSDWLDLFQERMQTLRDDNSLSKWKRRPADIRAAALAEIRLAIMSAVKFIPFATPPLNTPPIAQNRAQTSRRPVSA